MKMHKKKTKFMYPINSENNVNQVNKVNSINFIFFALCFLLFALCSLLFFISSAQAALKDFKTKVALFPFENLTDEKIALEQVMPVIRNELESKGFEILDDNVLNNFLLKKRVRNTGYVSKDLAQKAGNELKVNAIITGSINSFFLRENPQVGILARMIDTSDGSILWANQSSATGEDFTTILGLGTVKSMDKLISIVVERLFASISTTKFQKVKELTHRIAIMPFKNKSRHKDAGTVVTYMFLVELFKNFNFEPVEYGMVREMVVNLRLKQKGELDYNNLKLMSDTLGVDGVLLGTVEHYSDGLDTSSPPEVAVSARLINARKNRIIWSDSVHFKGDDEIKVLDWGRIRSIDNVAYKVVSKLIQKMEKAKW
jgi:TolB-like protein